ncbi:MAG: guanylate kinase [Burkholderiaceae bacterium]|nr:guanylate kinase [Burkholderiaceae bacterium]
MSSAAGNVFLVVAPSGAGKSSLVNALLAQDPSIHLSVSCTTRAPRSGELDGKDYRFVTNDTFEQLRAGDQLLEWAQVHGNYYGTPRDAVDAAICSGTDILLEIDWQGARQVERLFPRAVGIFILPPSIAALRDRLTRRGQDAPDVIERRIQGAAAEIAHASEFEYVIINQDFSVALQELSLIIGAARLRRENQAARHAALFASLGVRS